MFLLSQMLGSCLHNIISLNARVEVRTLLLLLLEHTFPMMTRLSAITLCFISFLCVLPPDHLSSQVALIRSGNCYGGRKYQLFFTC